MYKLSTFAYLRFTSKVVGITTASSQLLIKEMANLNTRNNSEFKSLS
jgi:hypothetical protein